MSDQSEDVSTLWSHFDLSLSQHYPESDRTIIVKEDPDFYCEIPATSITASGFWGDPLLPSHDGHIKYAP